MLKKFLLRWASSAAIDRITELEHELLTEQRRTRVLQVELETMAAVIARDRSRIEAEGAAYARRRAECEVAADVHS